MSFVNFGFFILFTTQIVFSVNNEDYEKRRQDRFERLHKKRIENDSGNPKWDDKFEFMEELPQIPTDILKDIKENGHFISGIANGEQYESWLDEKDILDLLSDEANNEHEECNSILGDEEENNNNNNKNKDALSSENENDNNDNDRRDLQTCCGIDTRSEILGNPITFTPDKYVGRLTFNVGSQSKWCSAVLVDHRWILTAGHCVHGGQGGSWFTNLRFRPRQNRWYSSTQYVVSLNGCNTFTGWTQNSNVNWDIAMCLLTSNPGLGGLGFGYNNNLNTFDYFNIIGYPNDKTTGSMWESNDWLSSTSTYQLFCDACDTRQGMSGGPWYSNNRVYGTHRGTNNVVNYATRINKYKYDWMCGLMPGRC